MKNALLVLMVCFAMLQCINVSAQSLDNTKPNQDNICVLPAGPFEGHLYIPPEHNNVLSPFEKALSLSASYVPNGDMLDDLNCATWPAAAQTAFNHALSLWQPYLNSPYPITVRACWTSDLGVNTLGAARPNSFWFNSLVPGYRYPSALAEDHFNDSTLDTYEILAFFNADLGAWYYGTDGNPGAFEYDFVTVVMHEVGHGLGFLGVDNYDDGITTMDNPQECNNMADYGCLAGGHSHISIYSANIQADDGTPIEDFVNPSEDLGTLLTGGSLSGGAGGLFLAGTLLMSTNGGNRAQLYTPGTYNSGSTYGHFDDTLFPNELMQPILNSGQAIHNPGLADEYLRDMGWDFVLLPVELVRFEAQKKGETVDLNWETITEINNQGFDIERSSDARNWTKIGFKAGKGDTSTPSIYNFEDSSPLDGTNYYRLVQIDYDGSLSKSKIINVSFQSNHTSFRIFPNPVEDLIKVNVLETSNLPMQYQITNSMGQLIHHGMIRDEILEIESKAWPSGIYYFLFENGDQLKVVK